MPGTWLIHHGIIGQRWGVQNGPPYPIRRSERYSALEQFQKKKLSGIEYKEFTTLQSPKQTARLKRGSCHDQVLYELDQLKKEGIKADAHFLIEYDPKTGQGGTTHSFITVQDGNKVLWLENAWGDKAGVHEFDDFQQIERYFRDNQSSWGGNPDRYTNIEFSDFKADRHSPGEDLQTFIDTCLDD